MRRTTIFRSELAALAAALTLALPSGVAAQGVQRPIQQAQEPQRRLPPGTQMPAGRAVEQQPTSPAPASQNQPSSPPPNGGVTFLNGSARQSTASAPATHIVAPGETLWALAGQFLGDPLLWPEIYRLNTSIVEDPHWIYPGEELRLTPEGGEPAAAPVTQQSYTVTPQADTTRQAAAQNQQPTGSLNGPTIFAQGPPRAATTTALQALGARSYRAVRDGEYYSSGFLTEGQALGSGRILGNMRTFSAARSRSGANLYEDVVVAPPSGDVLQAGDLLLAFRRGDEVADFGQIVVPTGLLKVKGPEGDRYSATVVRMFGHVESNQELLKIQPFAMSGNQRAQVVTDGMTGRVIRMRDPHEVAQRQGILFLDKGANDGVKLGDMFQIFRVRVDEEHGAALEQDQARVVIVNTRAATSTAIIVELYRGDIGPQSSARQVRRMPS